MVFIFHCTCSLFTNNKTLVIIHACSIPSAIKQGMPSAHTNIYTYYIKSLDKNMAINKSWVLWKENDFKSSFLKKVGVRK